MKTLAITLAGLVILLTACGSSGGSSTASGSKKSPYEQALAYSQCMRSHGEPSYPDPDSQGQILVPPTVQQQSTQLQSAGSACKNLLPSAPPLTSTQQQQRVAQALKFAACMRSHGLPNYPDPNTANGVIQVTVPSNVDVNSPQFKSAQQACQSALSSPGAS